MRLRSIAALGDGTNCVSQCREAVPARRECTGFDAADAAAGAVTKVASGASSLVDGAGGFVPSFSVVVSDQASATASSGTLHRLAIASTAIAWSSRSGRPDTVTTPTTPLPATRKGRAPPWAQ